MRGRDISEKQLKAAEQYLLLLRVDSQWTEYADSTMLSVSFGDMKKIIAEYGAIRAASVARGGTVDEPGEIYLTGK